MKIGRVVLFHVFVYAMATLSLLPLVLMASSSLKSAAELGPGTLFHPPAHPDLEAWAIAWSGACGGHGCEGLSRSFLDSWRITVPAVMGSLVLGAMTGFGLAINRNRLGAMLYLVLMAGLFIPPQVILYPMIILTREAGLFGSAAGLVLAHIVWGLPLVTLLFRNFFIALPRGIVHAAEIDGAGALSIFLHIGLPAALPVAVVAGVLQFTYVWNDLLLSATFGGRDIRTVTMALSSFSGTQFGAHPYNVVMAAAMIAALPTLLIYGALARFLSTPGTEGRRS